MRILIPTGIYPPDIGWPASYVPKISSRFLRDGIDVTVITYSNVPFDEWFDTLGFKVVRIRRTNFFLWNYFKYFFAVLKHGKGADTIYLQDYFSAGIPTYFANLFLHKKLITKVVGLFSWEQSKNRWLTKDFLDSYVIKPQKWYLEMVKRFEKFILNASLKIITPSNYLQSLLVRFWVHEEKISTVYNSFDPFKYETINSEDWKNERWVSGKRVYVSVGRLVEWKNFDKLIVAFAWIENAVLFIIGDGPMKKELEMKIAETGQMERVFLLWSLTKQKVYECYQAADAFVLLSSYEGMSHTLIEAMSMGLFIISSDIEANVETLEWYRKCKFVSDNEIRLDIENIESTPDETLKKFDFENLYIVLKKELWIS